MKTLHSTFFKNGKGKKSIYTTVNDTGYHRSLRNLQEGRTYLHDSNTPLYFVEGMPLDKPLEIIKEIK